MLAQSESEPLGRSQPHWSWTFCSFSVRVISRIVGGEFVKFLGELEKEAPPYDGEVPFSGDEVAPDSSRQLL